MQRQGHRKTSPCCHITRKIATGFWRPGHDYIPTIVTAAADSLKQGDIVVISEKAVAMSEGLLFDESSLETGGVASFVAMVWMRWIWPYILSPLCHLSELTRKRLRSYPTESGTRHKQLALDEAGFLQALRHGSEGGIDVSNVPYAFACLPLLHPQKVAQSIHSAIREHTQEAFSVLLVDSDKTYSWRGLHIAPRRSWLEGIVDLGLVAYVLGRLLKWRPRSTPLAAAGEYISTEDALRAASLANRARGSGAGGTAWDMAERFEADLTAVSWKMMDLIKHYPIVLVRRLQPANGHHTLSQ